MTPWYEDPNIFWLGYLIGTPIGCGIAMLIIRVMDWRDER